MIQIKYQTSDLIPAPYAFAIELTLEENPGKKVNYQLELTYIGREDLTVEEIEDEGFTTHDDLKLQGILPAIWIEETLNLISKTEKTNKTELEESDDFWLLHLNHEEFYPKNPRQWLAYLEEIRQAILENSKIEKPLEITLIEVNDKTQNKLVYRGSFENKTLSCEGKISKQLKWNQLSYLLKDIFSGDFNYEKAQLKPKTTKGIYINVGDEYWFEQGNSYINKPQKLKNWL